jgi:hypothetical protein
MRRSAIVPLIAGLLLGAVASAQLVKPVVPDTPLAPADEPFDPVRALLTPGQPAAYLLTPGTTPAVMRSLLIMSGVAGEGCYFGPNFTDGSPVTRQPYWPQVKALEALGGRLAEVTSLGQRTASVAVVLPWTSAYEISEAEAGALRGVLDQLLAMQTGYRVLSADELTEAVGADGKLELAGCPIKAVILPRVRFEKPEAVEAVKRLLAGGTKVIATHNLPKGPEGSNWVEETFGVKSIDDIDEAVFAKGNAIVIPAELGRLAPILNGMQCENLFLYPPSRDVVSAHYVKPGDPSVDWHLLYNSSAMPVDTYLTLYRKCEPAIRNLDSGETHAAAGAKYTDAGTTLLPLALQPEEAVVLACKPAPPDAEDHHIAQAPGLEEVQLIERGGKVVVTGLARLNGTHTVILADGKKGKAKVEGLPPKLLIDGAWRFATTTPFQRQPAEIAQARVRAAREGDDTSHWAAVDLDDADWDLLKIGEPLPSLLPKWHAKWLTFTGNGEVRYYRRKFDLAAPVKAATVTVTADNGYELYVNGEKVGADGDWYKAETYDIAGKLSQGANAIAVRVTNEGSVGGLLCEAQISLQTGDLLRVATDGDWRVTREAPDGWQATEFDDSQWGAPEVGGAPPAAPWGDVPGLPAEPNTGREIWYRFDLPPGAARLRLPDGANPLRLYVDGEERKLDGLEADLGQAKGAALRQATLVIAGPDPLTQPIECNSDPSQILIGDWATQGLKGYAGEATYERAIDLPPEYAAERLFLDLGEVGVCASVSVNGRDVGTRLCRPFVFDLGEHVKRGRNRVRITVADTLAAASGSPPPAGIIGPVMVLPYDEVEVTPE